MVSGARRRNLAPLLGRTGAADHHQLLYQKRQNPYSRKSIWGKMGLLSIRLLSTAPLVPVDAMVNLPPEISAKDYRVRTAYRIYTANGHQNDNRKALRPNGCSMNP